MIADARSLESAVRFAAADRARVARDVLPFPELEYFRTAPCSAHAELVPGCQRCGATLRRHQRVGAAWLYYAQRGGLFDPTGTGKTIQVAALLAMMAETRELGFGSAQRYGRHALKQSAGRRAVIVCRAAAIDQWKGELARLTPRIPVTEVTGTRRERVGKLLVPWAVALIGPEMLANRRSDGVSMLEEFDIGTVIFDDIDPLRHDGNRTTWAASRLTGYASRVVICTATPLHKRLGELYATLAVLGGASVLGTKAQFTRRYIRQDRVWYVNPRTDQMTWRLKEVGVRDDRLEEFKARIGPLVLRRSTEQMDDVSMPAVQPSVVWLEPSAAQAERYAELQEGVLRKIREEGDAVTHVAAAQAWMHGWQICSGLATLDQNPGDDSVKLDWVENIMDGDLSDEKAVVFVNFKPNVSALQQRLLARGIPSVLIWGDERDRAERARRVARFWEDPACRVLIGTTSIEMSLNLQVARHFIAVDTICNPARMAQLIGRIKRTGGAHQTVYFHQLLLRGTQEEHYPAMLEREQALADQVWDEQSEVFASATPLELMRMIAGGAA